MKLSIVVIASVVAGTALGIFQGLWNFGQFNEANRSQFPEISTSDLQTTPWYPPADGPFPKAAIEQSVHDFGAMEVMQEKSHTFTITNRGLGVLRIRKDSSSCKCTQFKLSTDQISPGESAEVMLAWQPQKMFRNVAFRQEAKVETNDPENQWIVLTIQGELRPPIKVTPSTEIVFSKLKQFKGDSAEIRMYAYREMPLKILKPTFKNSENADYFGVDVQPIPKDKIDEEFATSGVVVRVSIKPGIAVGHFRQILELIPNFENVSSIDISINGKIVE